VGPPAAARGTRQAAGNSDGTESALRRSVTVAAERAGRGGAAETDDHGHACYGLAKLLMRKSHHDGARAEAGAARFRLSLIRPPRM